MSRHIIESYELFCRYPDSNSQLPALTSVTLTVAEGDFVVVSGPNGSGKTTLLNCLSGVIPNLVKADVTGTIKLNGQLIGEYEMSDLSKTVGIVLEDADSQIFGSTVLQYLAFGLELMAYPLEEMRKRIADAARLMGISHLMERGCQTLSGGEKQRIVLASVLTMQPKILILDEPSSQLDPIGTHDLFEALKNLNREFGLTIVIAEHKIWELSNIASHLLVLNEGHILAYSSFQEVLLQSLQKSIRYPQIAEFYHLCKERDFLVERPLPLTVGEGVEFLNDLLSYSNERRSA